MYSKNRDQRLGTSNEKRFSQYHIQPRALLGCGEDMDLIFAMTDGYCNRVVALLGDAGPHSCKVGSRNLSHMGLLFADRRHAGEAGKDEYIEDTGQR